MDVSPNVKAMADTVIDAICAKHRISKAEFLSLRRGKSLMVARRECAVGLRRLKMRLPLSLLMLVTLLGLVTAVASSSAEDITSAQAAGKRNEYAVLKYLS